MHKKAHGHIRSLSACGRLSIARQIEASSVTRQQRKICQYSIDTKRNHTKSGTNPQPNLVRCERLYSSKQEGEDPPGSSASKEDASLSMRASITVEDRVKSRKFSKSSASKHEAHDPLSSILSVSIETLNRTENITSVPLDTQQRDVSSKLASFVGSLPIRNYARDFNLWDMSPDDVWRRYNKLDRPRCKVISRDALRLILNALAKERPRTRKGMQRYLSIVEDMLVQNPIILPDVEEWTTCISYVGRQHKNPVKEDLENALQLWRKMEEFNVPASTTTFNVLLDIAVRTKRWSTTTTLVQEMKDRGHKHDRYTWTTLIAKAGQLGDSAGLREVCKTMLESGEIIDIYILNAIMAAYIRVREPDQAEILYKQIKEFALQTHVATGQPSFPKPISEEAHKQYTKNYMQRALVNRAALLGGAKLRENDLSPRGTVTSDYFLMPDVATCNVLLQHYCVTLGDFTKAGVILSDMETFNLPDTYSMYKSLMIGFALYGNATGPWSLGRLDYIFSSLIFNREVSLKQDLVVSILRAYRRTAGVSRAREIWTVLDDQWQNQGGNPGRRSDNVLREVEESMG